MAVNVKMGVDLSSFSGGIREGQAILKSLNAEMKASEAEFKATGNAEQKLASQTKTLNSQLQVQQKIAEKAAADLKTLDEQGVKPTDASYQKLYATLMNAQAGMNEAQAALNALDGSQQQAAKSAGSLADSVNGIGKKISLDQVLSGINSIKSGLESAAQKAVQLGEAIWSNVMDAAKWADDTATQALMYGIDVEKYQQMQKLVQNGLDTTVEAMLTAQSKLKKNIGSESKAAIDALQELGVAWDETVGSGKYGDVTKVRDSMEVFWEAGQKIMALKDDPNAQESMAQALFGRSWKELIPLFDKYKSVEEYNAALEKTKINSAEDVDKLAELNDKVSELKGNFETLSREVWAQMAPALTDAADALNGLLTSVLEYLETEEGQEMLKSLGDSVSELFSGMKNINAKDVVDGFKAAFDKVVEALTWIKDNKDSIVTALEGVFGFWATLKVGSGVGDLLKLINGIKGLTGGGAGAAAGGTGTAATTGILTTFKAGAANVLKTLPFAAPVAMFIDGLIQDQKMLQEWQAKGEQNLLDYSSKSALFAGQDMFGIWDTLTKYGKLPGTEADISGFAQRYMDVFYEKTQDPLVEQLVEAMTDEQYENFHNMMERIASGDHFYSQEDQEALAQAINDAITAAENIMTPEINAEVKVPDDTAAQVSQQVGTVLLDGKVVTGRNGEELFANGIWHVPYDGMLARLHKGERVMPAREVQSRNFSSNLYVENMNMNGGLSADALAASIASRNSRIMAGYGS